MSKLKDPGIILTGVLVMYAAFVFIWWPTDRYFLGFSLVLWLMFFGLIVWFSLAIIYSLWIEKKEEQELQDQEQLKELG